MQKNQKISRSGAEKKTLDGLTDKQIDRETEKQREGILWDTHLCKERL